MYKEKQTSYKSRLELPALKANKNENSIHISHLSTTIINKRLIL